MDFLWAGVDRGLICRLRKDPDDHEARFGIQEALHGVVLYSHVLSPGENWERVSLLELADLRVVEAVSLNCKFFNTHRGPG